MRQADRTDVGIGGAAKSRSIRTKNFARGAELNVRFKAYDDFV